MPWDYRGQQCQELWRQTTLVQAATIPANTTHSTNVGSMLGQRLRPWPNIELILGECLGYTATSRRSYYTGLVLGRRCRRWPNGKTKQRLVFATWWLLPTVACGINVDCLYFVCPSDVILSFFNVFYYRLLVKTKTTPHAIYNHIIRASAISSNIL